MIDIRAKEIIITESLKNHLKCEVVMANQANPLPEGDYVSYTIINPLVENNGTYGVYDDGVKRKEYQQIWSFTVHSSNDTRSKMLAIQAHEYFDEVGVIDLLDNEISPQQVGGITCRDNLLAYGYEYRNGFDVTFSFISEIGVETLNGEQISKAAIEYDGETIEPIDPQELYDELNAMLQKRLDGEVN